MFRQKMGKSCRKSIGYIYATRNSPQLTSFTPILSGCGAPSTEEHFRLPRVDEDFDNRTVRGLLRLLPTLDVVRVQDAGLLGKRDS